MSVKSLVSIGAMHWAESFNNRALIRSSPIALLVFKFFNCLRTKDSVILQKENDLLLPLDREKAGGKNFLELPAISRSFSLILAVSLVPIQREVRIQSLSYFTGFRVKTPSASIEYIVELDYVRLTRLWRDLIKGLPQLAGISSGYSCWLNLNSIRPCISSLLCSPSSWSFYTFPNGILNSFLSPF